jgi:hypothetical protein
MNNWACKMFKVRGSLSTTNGSKAVGVNTRLHTSHLVAMSELIACLLITIRCCTSLRMGTYRAGAMGGATIPGVLLRVTCWWTRGVSFNIRFAVRLRASIMPGAFVIPGIVMIGDSSITLCSALRKILSFTLCSLLVGGGTSHVVIQSWRSWRMH